MNASHSVMYALLPSSSKTNIHTHIRSDSERLSGFVTLTFNLLKRYFFHLKTLSVASRLRCRITSSQLKREYSIVVWSTRILSLNTDSVYSFYSMRQDCTRTHFSRHCTCLISISEIIIPKAKRMRRDSAYSLAWRASVARRFSWIHKWDWQQLRTSQQLLYLSCLWGACLHSHKAAQRKSAGGGCPSTPCPGPPRPLTGAIRPPKAHFHKPGEHRERRTGRNPNKELQGKHVLHRTSLDPVSTCTLIR